MTRAATRCGEWLTDVAIRMRARPQLYATPFNRYRIGVARTVADHREAFRLLQIAYCWLGIDPVGGPELRISPQHVLPESTILVARDEAQRLVGTMTVTLDSTAGLPLEQDYPAAISALRRAGRRLVEYGALAVVQRCKHTGVASLLAMAANWFAQRFLRASDVVMGVHPRTAPLYRALYRFRPLGAPRHHAELEAPVQGMVQDLTTLEGWFRARFSGKSASGLPLHSHYFDALPSCIVMPPVADLPSLARWKLPRSVFRRMFIESSDRLETLDARTRAQLQQWRSSDTTRNTAINDAGGLAW